MEPDRSKRASKALVGEAGRWNRLSRRNLKLRLRGSVEQASSKWAGSAEKDENRIGLDKSVRPGSPEEAESQIGWRPISESG